MQSSEGLPRSASFPAAVEPFYRTDAINQPLVLFRGRVDLAAGGAAQRCRGEVVVEWLPAPAVYCTAAGSQTEMALHGIFGTASVALVPRLERRHVPLQLARRMRWKPKPPSAHLSDRVRELVAGNPAEPLHYALAHMVNFPRVIGSFIQWSDGAWGPGRVVLEGGGWRLIVDQSRYSDELEKELQKTGGYAITHVARVERPDGAPFTANELQGLLDALTHFCWLAAEARCGPILPVGFDRNGAPSFARWSMPWIEPFGNSWTWLDMVHPNELKALFPGFMERYQDPYWRSVVIHAIQYMIEAGRPSTVERALIMGQLMLEAVSYSWLVEEVKVLTRARFEKRKAAENIRNLLVSMGIPIRLPDDFASLATLQPPPGAALDGPQCIVTMRNRCVHRRRPDPSPDYGPLVEAWRLTAWYCELVLLRVCRFDGLYRSRLAKEVFTGTVEPVPWSSRRVPTI